MNFSLSDQQLLIVESADNFLKTVSNSKAIRNAMQTQLGYSESTWSRVQNELGWHIALIPDTYHGLGLGYVEIALLMEKMGYHLLCSPFFSLSMAINALLIAGSDEQKQKYFEQISCHGKQFAFAYTKGTVDCDLDSIPASSVKQGSNYRLNGIYSHVIDGHSCDYLIVAATNAANNIELFVVNANQAGVQRHWLPTMDQTRKKARIILTDVDVNADSKLTIKNKEAFNNILSLAAIALASELAGLASKALDISVEYITQRKQFNRTIGSFQAIKHKAADMMLKAESARSAIYYAACIADEYLKGAPLGSELQEAANIAKAYTSDAAFFNTGCAIQMHGGVGFTWEYDIHLYFKRAKASQHFLGNASWHREQLAQKLLSC